MASPIHCRVGFMCYQSCSQIPILIQKIGASTFPTKFSLKIASHALSGGCLRVKARVPAQAPDICVINLSIGDPARPFIHMPSPWARLLDWLSWKYRVLFCVSAGNYLEDIDIGLPVPDFQALTGEKRVEHVLKCIHAQLSGRRILSPAESINAITVGATHSDNSGNYCLGQRTDLLPHASLSSPAARLGHGFRRSVKPEILFPGGRQLYGTPH